MGNLTELNSAQTIKLAGANTTGVETGFVKEINNRLAVDAILNSTPLTTTFSVNAQGIAIGNNKSMLSVLNATGSGVKIRLRDLKIINVQTTSVFGAIADFQKFRFTGHSAGTLIVPNSNDTTDVVNALVTCRTGATITGEAAAAIRRWQFSTDEWGAGAADVESAAHMDQLFQNCIFLDQYMKAFTLNPGEGFHIKQVVNSTTGTFDIQAVMTQE